MYISERIFGLSANFSEILKKFTLNIQCLPHKLPFCHQKWPCYDKLTTWSPLYCWRITIKHSSEKIFLWRVKGFDKFIKELCRKQMSPSTPKTETKLSTCHVPWKANPFHTKNNLKKTSKPISLNKNIFTLPPSALRTKPFSIQWFIRQQVVRQFGTHYTNRWCYRSLFGLDRKKQITKAENISVDLNFWRVCL